MPPLPAIMDLLFWSLKGRYMLRILDLLLKVCNLRGRPLLKDIYDLSDLKTRDDSSESEQCD